MKIIEKGLLRQVFSMAGTHFLANITLAVIGLIFISPVLANPVYKVIFSVVTTAIYAMVIYSKAWKTAQWDKKPTTETEVCVYKGAVLPIGAIIFSIILLGGYLFAWEYLTIDGALASATAFIYNVVYLISTFAFNAFLGLANGSVNIYGHIVMYIVPVVASVLGYIAGMRGFSISDKLIPMIYEKKK